MALAELPAEEPPGVEDAAVLSTEAGGLEAGRLRVCAGRGCVGSAILEDTVVATLFEVVADEDVLLLLLAIC